MSRPHLRVLFLLRQTPQDSENSIQHVPYIIVFEQTRSIMERIYVKPILTVDKVNTEKYFSLGNMIILNTLI